MNQKIFKDGPLGVAEKVIKSHLEFGDMTKSGNKIAIKIDDKHYQDATGGEGALAFEKMGLNRVVPHGISAVWHDHNTVGAVGASNSDVKAFLKSWAQRYGAYFFNTGYAICHHGAFQRFDAPGKTGSKSDSHSPTGGGLGMLYFGDGALQVTGYMSGEPKELRMPKIRQFYLVNSLPPGSSAMDIALYIMGKYGKDGCDGWILEFGGPGVRTLHPYERASICNFLVEGNARTSIFPSDGKTRRFLTAQGRPNDWFELKADEGAKFDDVDIIDLRKIVPMVSYPHLPLNVHPLQKLIDDGIEFQQTTIGSCTNGHLLNLEYAGWRMQGSVVIPETIVNISGSQDEHHLMQTGAWKNIDDAGVRWGETGTCAWCIGMCHCHGTGQNRAATSNRNMRGRSGFKGNNTYLMSVPSVVEIALRGKAAFPVTTGFQVNVPKKFFVPTARVFEPLPEEEAMKVEVSHIGDDIEPLLDFEAPPQGEIEGEVAGVCPNDTTTDHIAPGGSVTMSLRCILRKIAEFTLTRIIPDFLKIVLTIKKGGRMPIVFAGKRKGYGSSRNIAAAGYKHFGVEVIIALSYIALHRGNLIANAVWPFLFQNPDNFGVFTRGKDGALGIEASTENDEIDDFSDLVIVDKATEKIVIESGDKLILDTSNLSNLVLKNVSKGIKLPLTHDLTSEEITTILAGGYLREKSAKNQKS